MDIINQDIYDDFNFVIWIDMDAKNWSFRNLEFLKENNWDVCYANGSKYYDYYALRTVGDVDPSFVGEKWWTHGNNIRPEHMLPVWSAFNGMGIFRKEIFKKYRYDFKANEEVKKLFRQSVGSARYNFFKAEIEKDCPRFGGGVKDEETNIVWKNNSGYKGHVVCEHVCLNSALINNGYRIFINNNLIYCDSGR